MFISVTLKHSCTLLPKATLRITPGHIKSSGFKLGYVENNYQASFAGRCLLLFLFLIVSENSMPVLKLPVISGKI
jgi:hypothetical protein